MCKSEHCRFSLLSLFCLAISLAGVYVAVTHNSPSDGGRGGAIAVAVSFAALFLTRDHGAVIHDIITRIIPEIQARVDPSASTFTHADPAVVLLAKEIDTLKRANEGVMAQLKVDAQGQKIQNRYLAFSSCVGTLIWGFGDMIAQRFVS